MDTSTTIADNNYHLWTDAQKRERTINKIKRYGVSKILFDGRVVDMMRLQQSIYKQTGKPYTPIREQIQSTDKQINKISNAGNINNTELPSDNNNRVIYEFYSGIPDGVSIYENDTGTVMDSSRIEQH